MEQNNIPADVQERIEHDARDAARGIGDPKRLDATYYGYIAGATAEALKYAELKNQYDSARSALDTKQCELLREIGENNAIAKRAQNVIAAFEAILNVMPNGDALRYFHAKEEVIKGRQLLQQWKDRKEGKE